MCVAALSPALRSFGEGWVADLSDAGPLPQNTMWAGLLALALFALLVAAEKAVSIYAKTRKPKPDHEVYATKDELAAVEGRVTRELDDIGRQVSEGFDRGDRRMNQMEGTLSHLVNDMARGMGRLEGQLSARLPVVPVAPIPMPSPDAADSE